MRERLDEIERLRDVLPAIQAAAAPVRGRLPGRWRGAGRAARRAEPRPGPDGRGRRDRRSRRSWRESSARRSHPHEKFQTAVVKGATARGGEVRVDVATARTEFYGAPGALPEVERSTLRHDLARRDFTINAMATSLKAEDLGATYDFFGGYPGPAARHRARAAQPQLRRGPDAPAARGPLRGAARLSHGRPHPVARARVHRDAAGRRPRPRRGCATSCWTSWPSRSVAAALERMAELGLDRALHPRLDAGPRGDRADRARRRA